MWGSQLDSFSWRIDLKSKARHIEQINEPTAIMEIKVKDNTDKVDHYDMTYLYVKAVISDMARV